MKVNVKQISGVLLAIVALLLLQPAPAKESSPREIYTCGMDPQVVLDHPGKCPICGMTLRLKHNDVEAAAASTISVNPSTVQNMGFRSEVVERGPLFRTIRTFGTIDFDETHLTEVTARFRGWIDKLYADSTGQQVRQGEPLFEIYSPELFSAENDYLQLMQQGTNMNGMAGMKSRAVMKLKMFDLSDEQITKLERSHSMHRSLTVNSPSDGFVIEKGVVEGQMVDAGTRLYRIADLNIVWVQAQVYEQDLPFMKLGQEADVTLSYLPDRKFRGRVAYIYPTVDEKTRTVKVRMEFHNPGYLLKPGMFATVEMRAELASDAVLVPDSAVLRSGRKNTVFVVLADGKFEPRSITLGATGQNDVCQVLSGLNAGERVVTSGQFMVDSESQLREAIQHMVDPNATNSSMPEMQMAEAEAPQMTKNSSAETNTVYICSMPEHVAIRYDHPGKCPLCSMTLVPVSEATYTEIAEKNWRKEHPAEDQH